jgi:hypothetical protein
MSRFQLELRIKAFMQREGVESRFDRALRHDRATKFATTRTEIHSDNLLLCRDSLPSPHRRVESKDKT